MDGRPRAVQPHGAAPVPTDPLVEELDRLSERFHLSDHELAACIGISANTVRYLRGTGRAPKQRDTVAAIRRFIERSKTAQRRTDFTLAATRVHRGPR